jgi:hypothetical protein
MSSDTRQGQADHRALEVFERCARVARENGRTVEQCVPLITASIIEDAARRWWTRRGYVMPADDATQQPRG